MGSSGFEPTYKELKLDSVVKFFFQATVLSLPIRNWNPDSARQAKGTDPLFWAYL